MRRSRLLGVRTVAASLVVLATCPFLSALLPASVAAAPATATTSGTAVPPDALLSFGPAATSAAPRSFAPLVAPIVGIAATQDGRGDWLVAADGGVFTVGDARFHGSLGGRSLPAPIVGIAASPSGGGYWLVGADGSVYAFGDAPALGAANRLHLAEPIAGIAATPDGRGYWLVGADGGVFSYGDARFHGSATDLPPSDPVVGVAASPSGSGYWLVDATGAVAAFGSAVPHGSASGLHLHAPVVGIAATPDGRGYWLVGADGGVFTYGDARYRGSADAGSGAPVVGIAPAGGTGYRIVSGSTPTFLGAIAAYAATRADNITVGVYDIATGASYFYRPGLVECTASTVKVDILATLLHETQADGPLPAGLQALAVPMIEDSLDSAADALWDQLSPETIGAFDREVGMTATVPPVEAWWATTPTTVEDRLAILRTLAFPNPLLTAASRAYIVGLMEHVTPSQDWGATGGVPPGVAVALKNGFALVADWQMNTTGWVDGAGRDYLVAILTNENETESYGIETVNTISGIVWRAM
jgi:hypothetical protein